MRSDILYVCLSILFLFRVSAQTLDNVQWVNGAGGNGTGGNGTGGNNIPGCCGAGNWLTLFI